MKTTIFLFAVIISINTNAQIPKPFHWPTDEELKSVKGYNDFKKKTTNPWADIPEAVPKDAIWPKSLLGNWCTTLSFDDKNNNGALDGNEKPEKIPGAFCFNLMAKGEATWSMAASPMKIHMKWWMEMYANYMFLCIYNPVVKRASYYYVYLNNNMVLKPFVAGKPVCEVMEKQ